MIICASPRSRLGRAGTRLTLAFSPRPAVSAYGLPTTPEQIQAPIVLYNGTLLTLVIAPRGSATPQVTLTQARSLVSGVLDSSHFMMDSAAET